ncbi:MAG: adenylyltransferase/cytidyltransferase family protein, partial [Holophagales bacterium]|nr:adenylyltransferase/cytidyltransferase family protein [Holophagales bacterium]
HNNSWKRVAIYGGGDLGKMLYEKLYATEVTVTCIIDQNPSLQFPYNLDVVAPKQFLDLHPTVDAVIVTPIIDSAKICHELSSRVACSVVSLDSLIIEIEDLEKLHIASEIIEQIKARMFILDLSDPGRVVENMSSLEILHKLTQSHYINHLNRSSDLLMSFLKPFYEDLPTCNEGYISEVCKLPEYIYRDGISYPKDIRSKYFNVIHGMRYTTDNPSNYDNTIHFFGDCRALGILAEDKYTIQSQLQRLLNISDLSQRIRVLNYGSVCRSPGIFYHIEHFNIRENDMVVFIGKNFYNLRHYVDSKRVHFYSLDSAFDRPHTYGEVLLSNAHMNHRGYRLLADKIYSILSDFLRGSDDYTHPDDYRRNKMSRRKEFIPLKRLDVGETDARQNANSSLDGFLAHLKSEKTSCDGVIGSIVMNCNPFTLGHRYLIEEALKQCDFLYIFVVEEDKSSFPFKDRLLLVKAGTDDLGRLKVLPSGSFMISLMTFPEYFLKDSAKDAKLDASEDIRIFAESIAPSLNISKRFVGEEPTDPITRQYNLAMIEELPRSGIEVTVIPRKLRQDGTPISASCVRALLEERRFDCISQIVPEPTLKYLKDYHVS